MAYDPKRPRPQVAAENQVDALIEPVVPVVEPLAVVPEIDENTAGASSADRQPAPVVPAPAQGTANRAVVAAVAAAVAALVAVVVLLRRRRKA